MFLVFAKITFELDNVGMIAFISGFNNHVNIKQKV